jgi:hypothetical protein
VHRDLLAGPDNVADLPGVGAGALLALALAAAHQTEAMFRDLWRTVNS